MWQNQKGCCGFTELWQTGISPGLSSTASNVKQKCLWWYCMSLFWPLPPFPVPTGNRYLLECNPLWRRLLQHYIDHNCYTSGQEICVRRTSPFRRWRWVMPWWARPSSSKLCYACLGKDAIFPLLGQEPPHESNALGKSGSLPACWQLILKMCFGDLFFVSPQPCIGTFTSSKPKSIGRGWMGKCDFIDDYFFLTRRCSVQPPSYLLVQLCLGDQTHIPFVGGGMTACGRSTRQAVICPMGPNLLSSTIHFKIKARGFLRLLISQSRKIISCWFVFLLKRRKKAKREPRSMLSSQSAVLRACKYHWAKAKLVL